MGRFCGIDPSLIDEVLEAVKQDQKGMVSEDEGKKDILKKDEEVTKEILEKEKIR